VTARGAGVALLVASLACGATATGNAQETRATRWQEAKCARYAAAWPEALARFGTEGLGAEFLRWHEAFLASGCRVRDVCPRSRAELDLANAMTVAAMNAGAASTFPPFLCRD
jgi:hypothetical protein